MRRDQGAPAGTLKRLTLDSKRLEGNPLGDPTRREIPIYIPAGHDGRGLPLLFDLIGFTRGGPAHTNWAGFEENVPERLDRLIGSGEMSPCVVAFPDCFTKLGGNQYINSAGIGPWADFLIEEAAPFVEAEFGCGGEGRRGLFGKSSGGYGALVHGLLYSRFWAAAACHSGDMGFELCYLYEFPRLLRALAPSNGDPKGWLEKFFEKKKVHGGDIHNLMMLAMCATYDPDPESFLGVRLPVDPKTCETIPERWANYMKWDPLVLVESHAEDLKRLKALYIDCGSFDQYNLVYGARRMHGALDRLGVEHTFEEFPDDHSSVDYRMDKSLPLLAKALSE